MTSIRNFRHLAFIVSLFIAASGCTGGDNFPALQIGVQAPAFTATLLTGETRGMNDYHGKGLVMIFMSSWCPCSNESIPIVKTYYERYKNDRVEFLMVGIQEAKRKFERFVDKRGISFPTVYDGEKTISRAYGVNAPPTMVFIDKKGIVKRVFYGNIKDKKKDFEQWIKEIV